MKVKLTIELDLPDDTPVIKGREVESLSQLVFDDYVNYVTVRHYADAVKWCAKAKPDSPNEDAGAKAIYLHHELWGDICSKANWKIEVTK